MEQQAIEVFDLKRMFIGDEPWWFAFEIAFRTLIIYLYTLGLVRILSQRTAAELSIVELVLIVALGSAVGDPMFYPDVPILHGLIVITVVVVIIRILTALVIYFERVETFVEGKPQTVVSDGILRMPRQRLPALAHEEMFEMLRLEGIEHLGQVRAAYLEQSGRVSVFTYPEGEERPGLAIEPPWDIDPPRFFEVDERVPYDMVLACANCGILGTFTAGQTVDDCDCGQHRWTDAVRIPNGVTAGQA